MDYIYFRFEGILVSHGDDDMEVKLDSLPQRGVSLGGEEGYERGWGHFMMTLSAQTFPSDTVTITYELRPIIICGDDDKGLIIPPYVLSSMLQKAQKPLFT